LEKNFKKLSVLVEKAIIFANQKAVSAPSKIQKWCLLNRDLSLPTGELTPTMKLKRNFVDIHFKNEIDKLYLTPSL
jgi:long-subunit acyl-CoA synthetase (AMP-forming)